MKKYYLMFVAAIVALVNLSAIAQDDAGVTLTIKVNNSDLVTVRPFYSPKADSVTLQNLVFENNETEFVFPSSATMRYLYITPVTPVDSETVYLLKYTLYDCEGEVISTKEPKSAGLSSVVIPTDADGGILEIECGTLQPISVTVNVDGDVSKFQLSIDGENKTVTAGSQEFVMPATVLYIMIRPKGVASLASVKYNGNEVELQSQSSESGVLDYYYSINKPADGSVVDIVTDYAAVEYNVTFDCNEPGFIQSVLVNDEPVEDWSDLKVFAGQRVVVCGHRYDYNVNSCGIGTDDDAAEFASYDQSALIMGDTRFWFNVSKIERSGRFVVYAGEGVWSLVNGTENRNCDDDLGAGYHMYGVEPSYDGTFSFSLRKAPDGSSTSAVPYVYLNDVLQEESWEYSLTLVDGDVVKAYFGTSAPAKYSVSFTLKDMNGTPEIVKDLIVPVTSTDSQQVLAGTQFSIAPAEGQNIYSVTVNGTEVAAEDGKYNFSVKRATNVEISGQGEASGVSEIESAEDAEVIYNLQGIRLDKDVKSLPKGIYIINGKRFHIN